MKIIKLIILAGVFMTSLQADVVLNDPSGEIFINISRDSVNRIVFPSKILARKYSKEKGLVVQSFENEAFLKYAPMVEQTDAKVGNAPVAAPSSEKIIYHKAKISEVFFVTENKTYSIVFKPKKIKPQTIRINENLAQKKSIIKYETKNPYKKTLKEISTNVFKEITPRGYEVKAIKSRFKSEGMEVVEEKLYTGTLYKAYLYTIHNTGTKPISLDERNYIPLAHDEPLFISTFYEAQLESLSPMDSAKLVIVTKGD